MKLGGCGGTEEARTRNVRVPVVKVKTPSTFVTGGISGRGGRLAIGKGACNADVPAAEHAGTKLLETLGTGLGTKRSPRGRQGEERGAEVGRSLVEGKATKSFSRRRCSSETMSAGVNVPP